MGLPDWLEPMAATLTQERFTGPEWIFERKYDGIRLLAFKQGSDVRLYSRNRLPQHHPEIVDAIAALPIRDAILDGEVTWSGPSVYHVFDVLWLDGRDVTSLPLDARRALLRDLPLRRPLVRVTPIDHPSPWELARDEGWEGVIAKRRDSRYEHRRSPHWVKMKVEATQELVVGGFTDPQGKRVGLGALLVGYFEDARLKPRAPAADPVRGVAEREAAAERGRRLEREASAERPFVFAGKVGTGFDTKLLLDLRARLDAIEIPKSPFTKAVGLPRLRAHWVRPEVVVQVAFIEWTVHGKLRHPRLIGVRTDKSAREVVRETS
jgi:bifunctional non-homologous end joining protein LigD